MKIFIFDQSWEDQQTEKLRSNLQGKSIDIIPVKDIAPLFDLTPLFQGSEPRILVINPDYNDRVLPSR